VIAQSSARRLIRLLSRSLTSAAFTLVAISAAPVVEAASVAATSTKATTSAAPGSSRKATSVRSTSKRTAAKPRASASKGKSRGKSRRARKPSTQATLVPANLDKDLALKSNAAFVVDQDTGEAVVAKNPDTVLPIASLTKLMTSLVVVESNAPLDELLEVTQDDVDTEKRTHSRLAVGTKLKREEMLLLALMASENRAASALSRHYPGGRPAFIAAMNDKAKALGMSSTRFADPAGLSSQSVSTARDLSRLVSAAYAQPMIRNFSTHLETTVAVRGRATTFGNTNRLVRSEGNWNIELQNTGFTNEAGRCLVMQVTLASRRLAMIFLDSDGTLTRYADAARVRRRLELEALQPKSVSTSTFSASGAPPTKAALAR